MNIRKITAAAALVAIGALALTGCSPSTSKTAGSASTNSTSVSDQSALAAGHWIVARNKDEITTLYDVDPKAGTAKEIDTSFSSTKDTLRETYVSGDSKYWVPSPSTSRVTTIDVKKLGEPSKSYPIDLVSTLPEFGQNTTVSGYRFDFTKPHTLIVYVTVAQADATLVDATTAWSYDATKPTKAPTKLGTVTPTSATDTIDTDGLTGHLSIVKPDGANSDGEPTYSTLNATAGDRPWGTFVEGDRNSFVYGTTFQTLDGTKYHFGVRDADTGSTLFITKVKDASDTNGTAFGKPIQNLPNDFDVNWVRPITK